MKGFKDKSGKFRPTGSKSKSTLKKTDVRKKQTVGVNKVNSVLRTKKKIDNEIKVTSVNFWTAENYGIEYSINDEGKVVYENGGLKSALEQLGARKLTTEEVGTLIDMDDDSDYSYSDFYGKDVDKDNVANDYAYEKQNDNTQNYLPQLASEYNFGTFKIDGRPFLSVSSENDSLHGIYDLMFIRDEEGLGEDHQSWYVGRLLDPEVTVEFTKGATKYEIKKANERDNSGSGSYYDMDADGKYESDDESVIGEYGEDLDKAVGKFSKGGSK